MECLALRNIAVNYFGEIDFILFRLHVLRLCKPDYRLQDHLPESVLRKPELMQRRDIFVHLLSLQSATSEGRVQ